MEKSYIQNKDLDQVHQFYTLLDKTFLNDKDHVLSLLSKSSLIRSLVVLRGEHNEYVTLLHSVFKYLIHRYSSDELLIKCEEYNISKFIFIEMLAVAYRKHDNVIHNTIYSWLIEHKEQMGVILGDAYHERAAWERRENLDFKKAIELNKLAIKYAREKGDELLETKILFGLTFNKAAHKLKLSEQIKDYESFSKKFLSLGDEYHAQRALLESYKVRLNLYIVNKEKNTKTLEDMYSEVLRKLSEYKKLENIYLVMISKSVLGDILHAAGNEKKAQQYIKEVREISINLELT